MSTSQTGRVPGASSVESVRRHPRWLAAIALLAAVNGAGAQPPIPLGGEFPVNSYTTSAQLPEALVVDGEGGFAVIWTSVGQDGHGPGIFGRRFDGQGDPLGGEFQINTYTPYPQRNASAAIDDTGGFVVVWESYESEDGFVSNVLGQRFDPDGDPLGTEFTANSSTVGYHRGPAVAKEAGGGFVVVWSAPDGSYDGVFGRRFDADGTPLGSEFPVSTFGASSQRTSHLGQAVDVDATGAFVVVWQSYGQDGSGSGIFGRRFDEIGLPLGGEFPVNTYTTGHQQLPSVARSSGGGFVVAWNSDHDGSGDGIFARRFDADGTALGAEFQVNEFTTGGQVRASVASDAAGNFVIAWTDYGMQDGSVPSASARRFSADGRPVGEEFQLNSYTTGSQIWPIVARSRTGDFVAAWASDEQDGSDWGTFGQRYRGELFADGFESGDTSAWSSTIP